MKGQFILVRDPLDLCTGDPETETLTHKCFNSWPISRNPMLYKSIFNKFMVLLCTHLPLFSMYNFFKLDTVDIYRPHLVLSVFKWLSNLDQLVISIELDNFHSAILIKIFHCENNCKNHVILQVRSDWKKNGM